MKKTQSRMRDPHAEVLEVGVGSGQVCTDCIFIYLFVVFVLWCKKCRNFKFYCLKHKIFWFTSRNVKIACFRNENLKIAWFRKWILKIAWFWERKFKNCLI